MVSGLGQTCKFRVKHNYVRLKTIQDVFGKNVKTLQYKVDGFNCVCDAEPDQVEVLDGIDTYEVLLQNDDHTSKIYYFVTIKYVKITSLL